MSDIAVLVSRLAGEQLADLSPRIGRAMAQALERLAVFPESAPLLLVEGYEDYRQLVVRGYRAIYRYFPDEDKV
ncbi:MAG: type II toxin-antitoxin system RelE/ParE family toxin, partial [Anaerolineae bacterium]|nr:type II toxin-antitoxin system RelE/ParE family toxin [Anaerolineae bacterium]